MADILLDRLELRTDSALCFFRDVLLNAETTQEGISFLFNNYKKEMVNIQEKISVISKKLHTITCCYQEDNDTTVEKINNLLLVDDQIYDNLQKLQTIVFSDMPKRMNDTERNQCKVLPYQRSVPLYESSMTYRLLQNSTKENLDYIPTSSDFVEPMVSNCVSEQEVVRPLDPVQDTGVRERLPEFSFPRNQDRFFKSSSFSEKRRSNRQSCFTQGAYSVAGAVSMRSDNNTKLQPLSCKSKELLEPIAFISEEEFYSIASYIRRRISVDKVNTGIIIINQIIQTKYGIDYGKRWQSTGKHISVPQWFHKLSKDVEQTEDLYWFSECDICLLEEPLMKMDSTRKAILTSLRLLQRLIRLPGTGAVRYCLPQKTKSFECL